MGALSVGVADLFESRRQWALVALGLLVLAVVPFVTTPYTTQIAFTGLVYVMLGVSWNLIAGYAGQISLGHSAFFGIGAFVSAWVTTPGRAGLPEVVGTPMLAVAVSFLAGGVVAGLLALVIGPIIFRLTGHYFAVGTLAFAAIVQLVLLNFRKYSGGATGYYVRQGIEREGLFLVGLLVTVAMVLATYWIVEGSLGLGMRAIHGDETAANGLGVSPLKYKMYAFVVSSFMAGVAGTLFAQYILYINAESTASIEWMIDTLVVVVLGGMGTLSGPILGAAVFLGLDTGLRSITGEFTTTVEGLLIILIVVFAPDGLYGLLSDRLGGDGEGEGPSESAPSHSGDGPGPTESGSAE